MTEQNQTQKTDSRGSQGILDKIESILSEERLNAYKSSKEAPLIDALAGKAWNMALCGSLYPLLQIVEICLRNSIHYAICDYFDNAHWFCDPNIVMPNEQQMFNQTVKHLEQLHRQTDSNHVLSELSFGFWTNLLSKPYERKIWHPLIKKIFPHAPKQERRRKIIFQRFRAIRKLRNRVFHHQRIWHLSDLQHQKMMIAETIAWIEPAVICFINQIDTFDQVYAQGIEFYKKKMMELI